MIRLLRVYIVSPSASFGRITALLNRNCSIFRDSKDGNFRCREFKNIYSTFDVAPLNTDYRGPSGVVGWCKGAG